MCMYLIATQLQLHCMVSMPHYGSIGIADAFLVPDVVIHILASLIYCLCVGDFCVCSWTTCLVSDSLQELSGFSQPRQGMCTFLAG